MVDWLEDAQRLDANMSQHIHIHPLSFDVCTPSDLGLSHSRDSALGVQARPANRCIRVSGTESIRAWPAIVTGTRDRRDHHNIHRYAATL